MMKSEGKVPNFHVDKNGQEWAHQVRTGRVGAPTEILLQNEANQQSEQRPNLGFLKLLVPERIRNRLSSDSEIRIEETKQSPLYLFALILVGINLAIYQKLVEKTTGKSLILLKLC